MNIRRLLAILLAVVLSTLLATQIWAAAANEPLDLNRQCWLTVNPCSTSDKEMLEDLSAADVVVDLYKVADMKAKHNSYYFETIKPFDLLKIPQDIADDRWAEVAQSAANTVLASDTYTPDQKDIKTGTKIELQSGLYLLVAHKKGDADYVKTVIDEDGNSRTVTQVRTDKHLYTFAPELVSLPSKLPENGAINTANPGDWIYDLEVNLKPELNDLKGKLEIVKTLRTFDTAYGPATFVFQLDWYENGKHYSDVRTITFSSSGKQVLTVELPVGVTVTVTEIYSGAKYEIVGSAEGTAVIEADEVARVEFINDYDEDSPPNGGGTITNKFTYSDGEWHVTQQVDSTEE